MIVKIWLDDRIIQLENQPEVTDITNKEEGIVDDLAKAAEGKDSNSNNQNTKNNTININDISLSVIQDKIRDGFELDSSIKFFVKCKIPEPKINFWDAQDSEGNLKTLSKDSQLTEQISEASATGGLLRLFVFMESEATVKDVEGTSLEAGLARMGLDDDTSFADCGNDSLETGITKDEVMEILKDISYYVTANGKGNIRFIYVPEIIPNKKEFNPSNFNITVKSLSLNVNGNMDTVRRSKLVDNVRIWGDRLYF
ncbi:hypothetical protein HDU76_001630 [Blyttiomyces sp. JEL0837]|nr:hypothetical protein HDU76_001630 [Blyttiomyces sp. JEL0837]